MTLSLVWLTQNHTTIFRQVGDNQTVSDVGITSARPVEQYTCSRMETHDQNQKRQRLSVSRLGTPASTKVSVTALQPLSRWSLYFYRLEI